MIVICPKCKSRFRLDSSDLGETGRLVKCGECADVWHQEPDEDVDGDEEDFSSSGDVFDEISESDEESIDDLVGFDDEPDIPESIKPDSEDHFVSAFKTEVMNKGKLNGFGAAGGVFVFTFIVFLLLHGSITSRWPSAQGAYGLFGVGMDVPGEGLVFDRMRVVEKGGALRVEGNILNLGHEDKVVPMIEAALKSETGETITRWYIKPPKNILEAEGALSFESVYDAQKEGGEGALGVHLRFILARVKTDAKDDGNIDVPLVDDQAHQTVHEES